MSDFRKIGVIGGGSWGTALALVAARAGRDVTLYARDPETVAGINQRHENQRHLPGIRLDKALHATTDMAQALDVDAVLLVTPAQSTRDVAQAMRPLLKPGIPVVICAKGIERASGDLLDKVLAEALPGTPIAVLSGPSFAADVASGLPTAVTIAASGEALADALARSLANDSFRPYATTDVTGVLIGGALKNVLAIACGVVVGRALGASAQAALIARGFAELGRLGAAMGAKQETLAGLSGLGDLVLTCSSPQSRNMAFGIEIGRGGQLAELTAPGRKLVEGFFTAPVAVALAQKHGVDLPICQTVAAVLAGSMSVDAALHTLMTRPLKRES
ncbi:NAD(P)H-dependent glycerol-3-phosphate dehydrogenase [Breoghania sp. L-A4]|uniref:NAD(P)H-dependent glycerol-3-phosphate dehydrogenase n=1 Tax=Breoghania sp. L-A4 TaxID=2304600 RepID=UPI000E36085A|nr:NAD(P)H-dependent glycerol-3-phosphate dehydrogenase [Breoghania sp. L-A4]AXS42243.1 NAD(P)-dependent glycerol-3-phosphate dehydrogenase [Breoghania sp. L-A4]